MRACIYIHIDIYIDASTPYIHGALYMYMHHMVPYNCTYIGRHTYKMRPIYVYTLHMYLRSVVPYICVYPIYVYTLYMYIYVWCPIYVHI